MVLLITLAPANAECLVFGHWIKITTSSKVRESIRIKDRKERCNDSQTTIHTGIVSVLCSAIRKDLVLPKFNPFFHLLKETV